MPSESPENFCAFNKWCVCVCVCVCRGEILSSFDKKHGFCMHCLPNTFAVSVRNFISTSLVLRYHLVLHYKIFGGSDGKESTYNMGDPGLISGLGRYPGEGNGNPVQYSCLKNSMERGASWLQSMESHRVGHD